MRISVFGMGYVGCVSAGCLADMGHDITAVEPNPIKLNMINEGRSPIVERGLDRLIAGAVQKGTLRGTSDWPGSFLKKRLLHGGNSKHGNTRNGRGKGNTNVARALRQKGRC